MENTLLTFMTNHLSKPWQFLVFNILFLLLITMSTPFALGSTSNETDRFSLLAFKAKISHDPLGVLASWNESSQFCLWRGVTCGLRHQRVTELDLSSSLLKGQISSHLGNLSFLRTLNLQNNTLTGKIPPQIGSLFRLKVLRLQNNSLGGEIPLNLSRCSDLQYLSLGSNNLTGKIPNDLGSLSKLQVLNLRFNNFWGELPSSFGNLSSLEMVTMESNNFHGSLPNSFGKLKGLTYLAFGLNILSGQIPSSLYNISSLELFSVHTNLLEGTLPSDLGHKLPNLEAIYFHSNQFSGRIPASISNASRLSLIQVSTNKFSGEVPSFAGLTNLYMLTLHVNNLGFGREGDLRFLSSLLNCTNLQVVAINDNNFGGVLPRYISNLSTSLNLLTFGRNQISGSIPIGIGILINLAALGLEGNHLTGPIPDTISKLKNLNSLSLEDNKLSGPIPSSLGNLTSLVSLTLMLNNLQGDIPPSLGKCKGLLALNLSQNYLSGTIPKEVIGLKSLSQYLDLSRNRLIGSIPAEVGELKNLVFLDISENYLVGKIPDTLGSCTSLEFLYLESNSLYGVLPQSLSSLRGIEEINLSQNNLSGIIPSYFEKFEFLQNLNLSFNNFEGEVPLQGAFQNASAFSIIGNARLCGGIPQLRLPKCSDKENGLSTTKKVLISVSCGVIGLTLVGILIFLYCSRKRKGGDSTLVAGSSFGAHFLQLSYRDLFRATDGFSPATLIGIGGFGSVYKGAIINDEGEKFIAVKVLNLEVSQASKTFTMECEVLKRVKHRNLVKLLTACSSIDSRGDIFKALVFEFMSNGNLEKWLHEDRNLNLFQRLNIAIDVANALEYLHHHFNTGIAHCDLKPSNVLLDGDMTAHVGDFGLARFLPNDELGQFLSNQTSSVGIRGSVGYAPPEYGIGSEVSTLGDIYSFGILVLEIFTGLRPTNDKFKDDKNLHNFVSLALLPEKVQEILDPKLILQADQECLSSAITEKRPNHAANLVPSRTIQCLISVLRIGIDCSAELPRDRRSIAVVVAELRRIRETLLKIYSTGNYQSSN